MDAMRQIIGLFQKIFLHNQGVHDGKDPMLAVVVFFHLGTIREQQADSGVPCANHLRLVGAHNGVQPAIHEHVEQGFAWWNGVNSPRYLRGESYPLDASRSLRPAGEPLDVLRFHPKVFLKHSPYPNGGGHMIFRKADFFSCQLLAADDIAVGSYKECGMTKSSRGKNGQRDVFSPAFVPQHRISRHRHLRNVIRRRFDHLAEELVRWGHVMPRQLHVVGRVGSVEKLAEIGVIDGGHV